MKPATTGTRAAATAIAGLLAVTACPGFGEAAAFVTTAANRHHPRVLEISAQRAMTDRVGTMPVQPAEAERKD